MKTLRQRYPFSAIVGQEELKQALLLNLIYPGIGGVLIRGEKGTAKSTAVRALEAILPEIDVVDGCPCGCDPHGDALCPWCLEQEALESVSRQVRVVDLPVGSTEDRARSSVRPVSGARRTGNWSCAFVLPRSAPSKSKRSGAATS